MGVGAGLYMYGTCRGQRM